MIATRPPKLFSWLIYSVLLLLYPLTHLALHVELCLVEESGLSYPNAPNYGAKSPWGPTVGCL